MSETKKKNGIVAAAHPLAAQAGLNILKKGGNAVDAAVAAAFVLDMVDPADSGIGGRGSMAVYLSKSDEVVSIDFNTVCPSKATPDMYEVLPTGAGAWWSVKNEEDMIGYRAVSVPGVVSGLCLALERYGTMKLRDVMQYGIRVAREGYPINRFVEMAIDHSYEFLSRFPATVKVFFKGGRPLARGGILRNPDYARTLEKIAKEGPEVFYKGEIARAIARDMEKNGGLITMEDLAKYRAEVTKPGHTTYRGFDVYSSTPTCSGGPLILQALNILDEVDLREHGLLTAGSVHLMCEAMKLAWADRLEFMADPRFTKVPTKGMLSKRYAAELVKKIDPKRAAAQVRHGDPWKYDGSGGAARGRSGAPPAERSGSTTHANVIDKDRNMVSLTQTLCGWFGSGVTVPGTGIVLNNGMYWFNPNPGTSNSIQPGKKHLNNQGETLLLKEGRPFMALGSPGGRRLLTTVIEMIVGVVDYGVGERAVASPRFHIEDREPIIIEHAWLDDVVCVHGVCRDLERMGHKVVVGYGPYMTLGNYISGPASLILVDPKTGGLRGAADPRQPGAIAGY
jgi:gamma-glutamyltranspeptidase/glutathione hydrolase